MTGQMRHSLDLVLTHVGTGADNRVICAGFTTDWTWEVEVEGRWMIAFTGTMSECIALERRYDDMPHVVETAWGDPVCVN